MKKKDVTMKKNTFINGTFITTLCIIITKVLGILYVIPFYAIIGNDGGALYGYAYTIYLFFMSLSSAGIPLAICKIVSEYQTLGYMKAKKRTFVLCKRIALLLDFICFLIILLCAPFIASSILRGVSGGNSVKDVTLVIRVIGTAILIVPLLSIYRGYFEGHRFMSPPSISQIIEQFFRVIIIVFGSLMALKVFNLNLASTVGVALFGASVGAFISYLYLVNKLSKNKKRFNEKLRNVNEPIVTDKVILKKIFTYAIPFIMIDLFKSLYNYIDMFSVVKGLVGVGFKATTAEAIYSIISTWGSKFNMIVLAISTGVIVNLIPNMSENIVKKDYEGANNKVNQSLNILLFLAIPVTLGISFLSKAIWTLFYGNSLYGPNVLSYYIFVGLFIALTTCTVTALQCYKDYKGMFISLFVGVILKLFLNTKLLTVFNSMSFPAYYGTITATIIGYLSSFVISLFILSFKYKVRYENTIKYFIDIICGAVLMIIILFLINLLVPVYSTNRLLNIFIIMFYGIVGCLIYFIYSFKSGLIYKIFGKNIIIKLKKYLKNK